MNRNTVQRVLSFLCLIVMMFSMSSLVFADDETPKNELKGISAPDYQFMITDNGTVSITEYGTDAKGNVGYQEISAGTAWTNILNEYNGIIKIIYGLFLLTCVLIFIVNFVKLGSTGGNPQARQMCMTGIIVSGIGTALLGGIGMFFQYAYNFFG